MDTNEYNELIKASKTWDLYQERAFKENLLNQRFHFFLVVYALIVAATASFKGGFGVVIVLSFGIFILLQLWYMIWIAYIKFSTLIDTLKDINSIPRAINVFTDNDEKVKDEVNKRKYLSWLSPLLAIQANESDVRLVLCNSNRMKFSSNRMMTYSIPPSCVMSLFLLLLYAFFYQGESKMCMALQDVPEVQVANDNFKRFTSDPAMRERMEARERFQIDKRLDRAEAEERGETKKALAVAKNMKTKGYPVVDIAEMTGLLVSEIERLN
jgi:hypothetical protein